jgi:thiol-disulfide isomerase/thioredoxin
MHKLVALASFVLIASIALAQPAAQPADIACPWSAQLIAARPGEKESYLVPFGLLIEHAPAGLRAALLNGSDRMDFSSIVQQGSEVTLRLNQYAATLTARCSSGHSSCEALEGEYVRQRGTSEMRLAFSAHCARTSPGVHPHVANAETPHADAPSHASSLAPKVSIASQWEFTFTNETGTERHAPANFAQDASHVEGTIAPISGDYGMLSGEISGGKNAEVHLSRFDGIHALRLDGHFVSTDRIEGVFHAAPGAPLNFVATRSASGSAGFSEAEHLTSVDDPSMPFRFHGLDASGATITQSDSRFDGKVVLLDIFGTWCPNCHDEAPVLQSLYSKFHARGLEIVGLSYEYVDDRARNQRLLEIYRRKYSIAFPLLLTGTTDSGQIAATLPQLRNFGAYPTTIFLDRHGRVRLIHAGFSGPATGRLDELKQSFEDTIVKLLDEQ